jgi:hypothetical protein
LGAAKPTRGFGVEKHFAFSSGAFCEVRSALLGISDSTLFHDALGLKAPVGIFNQSLQKIASRCNRVLGSLELAVGEMIASDKLKQESVEKILEALDHFLDSMIEHVDDCKAILRCIYGDAGAKERIHQFGKAIEPYRDHIGPLVNSLKHNQAQLAPLYFLWPGNLVFGYFVAAIASGQVLGPSKLIHADGNSGFSLNRNLPFHICGLFFIAKALHRQLPKPDGTKDCAQKDSDEFRRMMLSLSALPRIFFPDEVAWPVPLVKISGDDVTIRMLPDAFRRAKAPPNWAKVETRYSGDGVTRSFKLPYSRSPKLSSNN